MIRSSEEDDDDWCPPLPARTYLMDASKEELSGLSSRSDDLCYTPTLVSSPKKDPHKHILSSQLNNFDLLVRHQSGSQVSQSNPDLFTTKAQDPSEAYNTHHWAEDFKGESLSKGQFEFRLMSHTLGCDFFSKRQYTGMHCL